MIGLTRSREFKRAYNLGVIVMISRNVLERAIEMLPVASKDATRYSICGVRILAELGEGSEAKITLTATDGKMLLTRELSEVCPLGEFILRHDDAQAVKLVLKELKNISEIPCDIDSSGGLLLGQFTRARIEKLPHGTYPDYRQVIPVHPSPVAVALNAEFLFNIARALGEGNRRPEGVHVRLEFDPTNALKPILVKQGNNGLGVIMPVADPMARAIASEWSGRIAALAEVSA